MFFCGVGAAGVLVGHPFDTVKVSHLQPILVNRVLRQICHPKLLLISLEPLKSTEQTVIIAISG